MSLSLDDVRGIAEYARIALNADELTEMTSYLNDALERVLEPITHFELDGVVPVFHPIGDLSNVMRDDVPSNESLPIDVALQNTASQEDRFFRIPSILGNGGER
ncbi:MAG: Asp-tRNA(Asn)/Glu-tRNA(Gln) amidotransferase subunit GatC [Coriobacteriales bacterium]|nr:Asp-tRNA(Asn)/Glu-tRNA(Gln) amidotransferase subunit GatC [Coriobacteriales bacterium]